MLWDQVTCMLQHQLTGPMCRDTFTRRKHAYAMCTGLLHKDDRSNSHTQQAEGSANTKQTACQAHHTVPFQLADIQRQSKRLAAR